MLPVSVWGKLMPLSAYREEVKAKGGGPLNCFELEPPYTGMALVIDDRCPARFVNDSRGIASKPNIQFKQHPNLRQLHDGERLHLLLQARVALRIGAGEQLLCNYSDGYWQTTGGLEQSKPEDAKEEDDNAVSEEEEPRTRTRARTRTRRSGGGKSTP